MATVNDEYSVQDAVDGNDLRTLLDTIDEGTADEADEARAALLAAGRDHPWSGISGDQDRLDEFWDDEDDEDDEE